MGSGLRARAVVAERAAHVGQGLLMGGADVVPGVSGGTVALIVGIYERLVDCIRSAASVPPALVRGDLATARRQWQSIEWGFILPLAAGIVVAVAVATVVIPPLRDRYPAHMLALFLGLVAGSVPIPWRRIDTVGPRHVAAAAVAAVVAFVLVGLPPQGVAEPRLIVVAAAAAVAICAMILPGVSGAFLLEVFGLYEPTLAALRAFDVAYVAVFVAGAALGLGAFAKLLGWLLARRHDITMAVLVGLMTGALRALWPWQDPDRSLQAPPMEPGSLLVVALAVVGLALVGVLIWRGRAGGGEPG